MRQHLDQAVPSRIFTTCYRRLLGVDEESGTVWVAGGEDARETHVWTFPLGGGEHLLQPGKRLLGEGGAGGREDGEEQQAGFHGGKDFAVGSGVPAAAVDGASQMRSFRSIVLPLALPAIAVTGFLGFISGWTEFYYSWMFLTQPRDFTLAMALSAMTGTYASAIPWPLVSAFSIMLTLPPAIVYLLSQRFITGGLAVGSVKG